MSAPSAVTCARCATSGRLQLHLGALRPLSVSYADPALLARYRSMVASRDALLRAVDVARRPAAARQARVVWDATAGLGRDAGALAFAGAAAGAHWLRVVLLEREPLVARLLEQAREEAAREPGSLEWLRAPRTAVVHGDSVAALWRACGDGGGGAESGDGGSGGRPDVVYLDPMFSSSSSSSAPPPPAVGGTAAGQPLEGGQEGRSGGGGGGLCGGHRRRRTALPQREMQYLAALAGARAESAPADDAERLLAAALAAATERVVVKRHRGAAPVGGGGRGGEGAGARVRASGGGGVAAPPPQLPPPTFQLLSGHAVRYDVYRVGGSVS